MLYAVNTRPGTADPGTTLQPFAFGEFVIYSVHDLFLSRVADALPPLPPPWTIDDNGVHHCEGRRPYGPGNAPALIVSVFFQSKSALEVR
jgi:hypothetical protein